MSKMIHYIITNETVLVEKYANDRGPGQEIRGDTKNHRYLPSACSKIIFPDFSNVIFSLTFP